MPKIQTLDPAGLDRFTTELIGAGFHAVAGTGRRKWVGPILPCLSSLTVVETMGIEITDGWPYVQPRPVVRGVSGEHSNAAGVICLWRSDEVGLPWLTWDAIARRTEEWCERTAHGFREADEMLDAYVGFERTDSDVLVTFDLATLTAGIEQDGKHQRIHGLKEHDALISIHPGKGPAGSIPGRLFYRDTLSATPRTLADVERALTPAQLGRLNGDMRRRRTGDPPIDLAIVVWQRGGIEDLLVLRVDRSDGGFGLVSLEPAPRDAESLALRSGLDRGALSTKKVVVFGAGAVGSHAALLMGECGVGRLLLVDGDRIRPGNVVRHVAGGAVGRNKAQATALELEAHCPWVETKTVQSNIFGPNDIAKLIGGCDLVLDASGVWSFQQQLSSIVAESRTPLVSASLYRGGSVGRVRRQMADDEPIKDRTEGSAYYTIPREEEVADYGLEVGCSAPVTSAPPSAVAAVAALAVQVVQDALTGRNAYQPEITEVYAQLEQPPFDRVGRLQWPRS